MNPKKTPLKNVIPMNNYKRKEEFDTSVLACVLCLHIIMVKELRGLMIVVTTPVSLSNIVVTPFVLSNIV